MMANLAILFGSLLSAINWATLFVSKKNGRFVSPVPFLGAFMLAFGIYAHPAASNFWWICIFADYGTLRLFLALPSIVKDCWSASRFNLIHEFSAVSREKNVKIRLYRSNVARISISFVPGGKCDEYGTVIESISLAGAWTEQNRTFRIVLNEDERVFFLAPSDEGYVSSESNCSEQDRNHNYLGELHFYK